MLTLKEYLAQLDLNKIEKEELTDSLLRWKGLSMGTPCVVVDYPELHYDNWSPVVAMQEIMINGKNYWFERIRNNFIQTSSLNHNMRRVTHYLHIFTWICFARDEQVLYIKKPKKRVSYEEN